jgi:hypothetical protein
MSRKREQESLITLARRHGTPQPPKVDLLNSEVRTCMVVAWPPPVEPGTDGLLGGIVVIWEFSLPYADVQAFHDFLRSAEHDIRDSVATRGVRYHGTYMEYAPGEPRYRTIWAYESMETMGSAWGDNENGLLSKKDSPFYNILKQLRAFWLRDPNRSEARWVPARMYFDPNADHGDAFAKLTLDAAVNPPAPSGAGARQPRSRSR